MHVHAHAHGCVCACACACVSNNCREHPNTLTTINNLGGLLYAIGDLAAAEPLLREALERRRSTLGNRHLDTTGSMSNLSSHLMQAAKGTADPLWCRKTLEVQRETLVNQHPHSLRCINKIWFSFSYLFSTGC